MGNFCCFARQHTNKGPMSSAFTEIYSCSPHNPNGFFREYEFVNEQGLALRGYEAQPTSRKRGVVVLQHGVGSHALFEYLTAEDPGGPHLSVKGSYIGCLLSNGFAVYLMDAQGHGKSDAARNEPFFFEKFDDLARDFLLFTGLVRNKEPSDMPVFASGLSMGGGIVVRAAMMSPDFVKGLVLCCPMLSLERLAQKPINKILRPVASLISAMCPTLKAAQIERNTKFPLAQQEQDDDPMCNHAPLASARVAEQNIHFSDFMTKKGGFALVKTPFITFHSPEDHYVDPESSSRLVAEAQTEDKQVYWAEGMWHALTNEPGKEKIFEKAIAWLKEHS